MKKLLLQSLLLIGAIATAQNEKKCGFLEANEYLFSHDKTARARIEQLIKNADEQGANANQQRAIATTYTIPIVFHVLHLGGSENISDLQIQDAVKILNRDYSKKNADTASIVNQYKPLAADCQIEFQLATLDENGMCTNGITRHYTANTDWTGNFADYIYTWDRTKYLNVYVVRTMQNGAAGYTFLPGSVGATADAIVVLHNYTGSIGTSNTFSSRTLTHEAGHWFNLQHVWGSTNNPGVACGDDGVTDTPITKGHTSCNLTSAVCTSSIVENVQNYMEYAYCSKMFTLGQKTRMHNCLNSAVAGRSNLYTTANLIATGVINPNANCAPKAAYISGAITCVGNVFHFTDYSYNTPATSWLWSSPAAAATSTLQNGILTFTASGLASVKLKVSNAFGSDSIIKQTLVVLPGLNSGTVNLTQSFEAIFPDNNWIATTPQFGSGFKTYTASAATGTNCAWVNNFFDGPNEAVSIYSPQYNLQNVSGPQFSFKYAYTQQAAGNNDALKVFVSVDCGTTWAQIYSKTGAQLNTTSTVSSVAYLTPQPAEWQTEVINLTSYQNNQQLDFKVEFTPDLSSPGNNLFIDDINVSGTVGVKENNSVLSVVKVYPNPTKDILNIVTPGNENLKIQVLNSLGQLMLTETSVAPGTTVNITNFSAGIYFLKISSIEGNKIVKIIKE